MQNEQQPPEGAAKLLAGFATLREAAKLWNTGLHGGRLLPGPSALEVIAHQFAAKAKEQPPPSRPPDPEEARRQWQRYLTNRDPSQIERRALRRLCWDPEVADTNGFCGHNRNPPTEEAIKKLCNQFG